ncbi:hypothetical protein GFC29_3221 [Anoxybacillus sp. B7M1]|jgi:hypothetical protein|uniref:DUF3238 domain-containing protein n=1 Tax=Anoxybacillaceae TaxID=3120669 RepID=UPI0005CCB88D|nr:MULTISPECIES: DUF3238 domain-containing protein [Anoxybacillus]ANB55724.1 hypothetical protein GFC28_2215 [Anoxybacillus sp. B2M1]ANB63088.1 hypothetical protein GFC29_3221 [Anoxybacillus sp. B7M1]MBB3907764.1 hypothetical protein [Anoxybacillus rupiensis]
MAKLELRVRTFIPHQRIFFTETATSYIYYRGDNRNEAWEGSYRTSQRFVIDTSPSNYSVSAYADTGTTVREVYDKTTGKLISTSSAKASTSGLTYKKRVEDGILYLDIKCSVANPLELLAPAIDYEFTLKVTRLGSVRITGQHDGFPAYEFWRKFDGQSAELVWSHDPRDTGEGIYSLFPPMEHSIDKGLAA